MRQITGAEIRETVPDSLLIPLCWNWRISPRRNCWTDFAGKVYASDRAASAAAANFFAHQNHALRELALRLVVDHVGRRNFHRTQTASALGKPVIAFLVVVGPSPFSEPLIRWTRRIADSLKCPRIAGICRKLETAQ